ncbi:hypothetical protein LTR37_011857 [Vermiconidia calcicola]|uniref:Uncharacterized protein n=1 Tax=Vermiconidia calcicola TaxID=1690605 RepID=A0ACC3N3T8_9PEZI|nr:hypothetical protein LTR37_011857 [Vermiconidia calcicola]
MSKEYEGVDPIVIAQRAERDLNSDAAKEGSDAAGNTSRGGRGASDSTKESGVDENVENKFPGSEVKHGSGASGAGDNRDIPESEGGSINPRTGQLYKAGDFEGPGGPEEKRQMEAEANPGDNMVRENVRQQKEPQPFVSK